MIKTRKLPHALTKDGRASSRRGEHLVPCLAMPRENVFVSVKTGKKYDKGNIVYIGVDIGADDILKKIEMTEKATEVDKIVMESFLLELQKFKIGNVVSLVFLTPRSCVLKKEAEHPVFEKCDLPT